MSVLAINGGTPEVQGLIRRFNTIGQAEVDAAVACLWAYPLSGFVGSESRGGWHVCKLERLWCERFGTKHAVAVNSATSGLLIAAQAAGLNTTNQFVVSPWTMSATVAAPMLTQAVPYFMDIENEFFGLNCSDPFRFPSVRAMFITNLFGHPTYLDYNRMLCDAESYVRQGPFYLIEDNAQAIGAMEKGKYAGTIGHIGVWSLNIHKQLTSGEGGIVTTDDDGIADDLRGRMNHGEMRGGPIGLNLRMTELTAAIAIEQLKKFDDILASRRALAERLTQGVYGLPIISPAVRDRCTHGWYAWACKIPPHADISALRPGTADSDVNPVLPSRDAVVKALRAEGVPIRAGYMRPLYELPAFAPYKRPCPVTERVESEIALIELCSIDPTPAQIGQIVAAFHKVYEHIKVNA